MQLCNFCPTDNDAKPVTHTATFYSPTLKRDFTWWLCGDCLLTQQQPGDVVKEIA